MKLFLVGLACGAMMNVFAADKLATDKSIDLRGAIAHNIRQQLALRMNLPETQFKVEIPQLQVVPASFIYHGENVQVLGLGSGNSRRIDGLFNFPVSIEGKNISQEISITGVAKVVGPVAVAARSLNRGHVLEAADVEYVSTAWSTLPTGAAVTSKEMLLGQRVRNLVTRGESVFADLLDEPLAVRSNDMVELTVISGPGVMIRSRALARQEGKVGDFIRLEQPDTKTTLSGLVVGPKMVEVKL